MHSDFVWSEEAGPDWTLKPGTGDAFIGTISFDSQIMSIDRSKYRRELYRRPGPRHGKAYGKAMHRAMKKARQMTAWAHAKTIYKDWGQP